MIDFPNPPIGYAGHFWIKPDAPGRLCHLVKGEPPAEAHVRAIATVCGVRDLEGRAWSKVMASAACARCVNKVGPWSDVLDRFEVAPPGQPYGWPRFTL